MCMARKLCLDFLRSNSPDDQQHYPESFQHLPDAVAYTFHLPPPTAEPHVVATPAPPAGWSMGLSSDALDFGLSVVCQNRTQLTS